MAQTFKKETQLKNEQKIEEMLKTLPDYVRKYMNFIKLNVAASTRLAYLREIARFLDYIEEREGSTTLLTLDGLPADTINDWLTSMSVYEKDGVTYTNENISLKRKLLSVRGLYDYLFEQEIIEHNPARKVMLPKVPKKKIIQMGHDESETFLDTVQYGNKMSKQETAFHDKYGFRDFTLLSLMLGTGIRVSEAAGLNIEDIDMKRHAIRIIRKGGKEDIVYFSDELSEILSDYLELYRKKQVPFEGHEQALFLSVQRKRITIRGIQKMVKKYATHTELLKHITPHTLRRSYGTQLYEATDGDIYLVSSILGHESVDTTAKAYVKQSEERKEKARNMLSQNTKP